MPPTFTNVEQTYLDNLRSGTSSTLVNLASLPPVLVADFDRCKQFLHDQGLSSPQPRDLYLTVKRQNVIDLLQYASTNACLALQTCFGFDKPINTGGQVQLIQKGNMWQRPGADDATVFHSVFKRIVGTGPAQKEYYELFLDMNPANHIPVEKARQYLANFGDYYPGRSRTHNPFTLGYLLPVKALLTTLTNTASGLGKADTLTFRWGLQTYVPLTPLGDFSLVLGTGDTTTGPVIVFRVGITGTSGSSPLPPCPPNPGCQL